MQKYLNLLAIDITP